MNLYAMSSYKEIIRENILNKKALVSGNYFTFQMVAEKCGLQKTYFSRVLNGDAHFSSDHLQKIMDYLEFSEPEQEFIELLHAMDRTNYSPLKKKLAGRIARVRMQNLKTENVLQGAKVSRAVNEETAYFLTPNSQMLHLLLTIPKFGSDLNYTREHLRVSEIQFDSMIRDLERLGFIEREKNRAKVVHDNLHFSQESPLIKTFHTQMRLKAIEGINIATGGQPYSYSLFFSSDENSRVTIQALFLEFLQKSQAVIRDSPSEKLFQMGFDLLGWA